MRFDVIGPGNHRGRYFNSCFGFRKGGGGNGGSWRYRIRLWRRHARRRIQSLLLRIRRCRLFSGSRCTMPGKSGKRGESQNGHRSCSSKGRSSDRPSRPLLQSVFGCRRLNRIDFPMDRTPGAQRRYIERENQLALFAVNVVVLPKEYPGVR